MPSITVNYNAVDVPGAQVLPAYISLKTVYDLAAFPPAAKRVLPGASVNFVAKLNQNAHAHDYVHRYGAGQGIGSGFDISVSSGLLLSIAAGQAIGDGIIDNPAAAVPVIDNLDSLSPYGRAFLWLQQSADGNPGVIIVVNNSLTPPAGNPCVYLGSVKSIAGAITEIDVSGVFYKRGGIPWRQTADVDMPGDTPPANFAFLTRTLGGLFLWDGIAYMRFGTNYDIACFFEAAPTASQVVLRYVAPRAVTLPTGLTGSQFKAGVAATGTPSFTLKVNGTTKGSVSITSGGTVTWTFATPVVMAAGDVLTIVAPSSPDATLAQCAILLVAIL